MQVLRVLGAKFTHYSHRQMKKDIHPTFHDQTIVTCSCGATHVIGSTLPELKVEICSKCHPFYTGKQKLVDTEGRVDKFYARMNKVAPSANTASEATEEVAA